MRYIIAENKQEMGKNAAKILAETISTKPDCLLGLATGSTPIPLYKELVKLSDAGKVDFSKVRSVNLDEYIGLDSTHEQSYRYFMQKNLFDYIPIKSKNTALPDGMAQDMTEECRRYNELIVKWGGIDLQVLGIGHNGHIGFNEPGTEFVVKTHVVKIAEKTRIANARFFDNEYCRVPLQAITMGIGNIMSAKKIILLVSGGDKADILNKALNGPVSPKVPASVLQLHKDIVVIADKAAANGGNAQFDVGMKQVL